MVTGCGADTTVHQTVHARNSHICPKTGLLELHAAVIILTCLRSFVIFVLAHN